MTSQSESFKAWAVELAIPDGPKKPYRTLAGRYLFEHPHPSHEGCLIALFKTRKEAKNAKKSRLYTKAVRRVRVKVEIVR